MIHRHQPWPPSLRVWNKERTSGQSHPVMSYAQNFMKITPGLSSKKSHLHTLRYLSRMEISGVKSDLKIIFSSKEGRDAWKQLICTKTTVASAREQLTQEELIYIAKFPGVPSRRSQFVCCHYFESNTICWPCAPPSQLVCQGLIFGNGPRPQIASEEKSRCTRSNSAPRLKPKEC